LFPVMRLSLFALCLVGCAGSAIDHPAHHAMKQRAVRDNITTPEFSRALANKPFGVDVSQYQSPNNKPIDWHAVAAAGVSFADARASHWTKGQIAEDIMFKSNWAGMAAAGIIRAAYHYAVLDKDAVMQAQFFVKTVENAGGFKTPKTMHLVLDLEDADSAAKVGVAGTQAWVQAFVQEVKALTGKPCIIYTGYVEPIHPPVRGAASNCAILTPPPPDQSSLSPPGTTFGLSRWATCPTASGAGCGWPATPRKIG
jgi:GH25 family lysozyme M1 (1,4-beta-N-acetylmuramidase)